MATTLDRALRERLNFLCEQKTQAEVSRKTGASANNVSRYARGTRMPLDFGSALVTGMGVNPAWLLAGEGKPFLSDVAEDTGKTAGNLLELVQAMSAITRMRLGALSGKQHAQVLYELDDALRRYERLREDLNVQSRPMLAKLLDDYRQLLEKRKLARADEIRKAAEQVSRLCLDDALRGELDNLQARHERIHGNFEQAAATQRRIFLRYLATGAELSAKSCVEAQNFAGALWYLGRVREARAACRACLALCEDAGRDWPEYATLNATCGMMELDLGMLRSGARRIEESVPRMSAKEREFAGLGFLARARLLRGSATVAEILAHPPHSRTRATVLLRFCALREDREEMKSAVAALIGEGKIPESDADIQQHLFLRNALTGKADAYARFSEIARGNEGRVLGLRVPFSIEVSLAQIARLCGKKQAADHVQAANELLRKMGKSVSPSLETLAIHQRNLAALGGKQAARARRWLARMVRRGYCGLAGVF